MIRFKPSLFRDGFYKIMRNGYTYYRGVKVKVDGIYYRIESEPDKLLDNWQDVIKRIDELLR